MVLFVERPALSPARNLRWMISRRVSCADLAYLVGGFVRSLADVLQPAATP
jgi:hypothetical protein